MHIRIATSIQTSNKRIHTDKCMIAKSWGKRMNVELSTINNIKAKRIVWRRVYVEIVDSFVSRNHTRKTSLKTVCPACSNNYQREHKRPTRFGKSSTAYMRIRCLKGQFSVMPVYAGNTRTIWIYDSLSRMCVRCFQLYRHIGVRGNKIVLYISIDF